MEVAVGAGRPAGSLERIPLAGSGKPKEKFSLVDLAEFRGKQVDEVIVPSVEDYLDRSNYNHPGDIDELLAKIELSHRIEKPLRDALAAMMSRRHAIAHRADRDVSQVVDRGDSLRGKPLGGRLIDPETVENWIKAVEEFGEGVLKLV